MQAELVEALAQVERERRWWEWLRYLVLSGRLATGRSGKTREGRLTDEEWQAKKQPFDRVR